MRKIIDYYIATGLTIGELREAVLKALEQDFQPIGELITSFVNPETKQCMMGLQMVKYNY